LSIHYFRVVIVISKSTSKSVQERATSSELDETIELLKYEINAKFMLTPRKEILLSMDGNEPGAFDIKDIQDEFQFMKIELKELKLKVTKSGRGLGEGFAVDGKFVLDALEASAILEKEFPDGYVTIGCLVTLHGFIWGQHTSILDENHWCRTYLNCYWLF